LARRRSSLTPQYEFDPRLGSTGRYVNKGTGKIVKASTVLSAMETQISQSQAAVTNVSEQLAGGEIGLSEWQVAMRGQLTIIHTQTAALAKGGWASMAPADWGAVGQITAKQSFYLQRFAQQIQSGKQSLTNLAGKTSGQFLRRADLYAQAGNGTYHKMNDRIARQKGLSEERRILDSQANHCTCCEGEAARGWQPIGSLVEIGGCTCNQKCRCSKEYR